LARRGGVSIRPPTEALGENPSWRVYAWGGAGSISWMRGGKGVCPCWVVMRVGGDYLHLFVVQVHCRVGDERLGSHSHRHGVDQCGSGLPSLLSCRERSAEGLQDCVPEERALGHWVLGRWSKVWRPIVPNSLRLLPRVSWGEELEGRVLRGAFHRERQ
jgi:hypothetical protein